MKKHCSIISVIAFVIGVLYTLVGVWSVRSSGFWAILLMIIIGGGITYIVCAAWASFAEILEKLEKIEYQLRGLSGKNILAKNNSDWVCPRCGKINSDYVGTCSCGCNKTDSQYNWPK